MYALAPYSYNYLNYEGENVADIVDIICIRSRAWIMEILRLNS